MLNLLKSSNDHRGPLIELLQSEKLPVEDLPADLENFIVAIDQDQIIGAVGVEIYGRYGLLRSLVVHKDHRNKGVANKLINQLEQNGKALQLEGFYLLTETAPDYFTKQGYHIINRQTIPGPVKQSSEFSHVCPQSAIAMMKSFV